MRFLDWGGLVAEERWGGCGCILMVECFIVVFVRVGSMDG